MGKTLGTASCHDELIALLDRRRIKLGWTLLELDAQANLGEGHSGHIISRRGPHIRTLGKKSIDKLLDALGLALRVVVIEDRESGQRVGVMARPGPRKRKAA